MSLSCTKVMPTSGRAASGTHTCSGHAQCRASHISHEGLVGVPEATELQQGLDDRLLQRLLRLLDRVAVPAAFCLLLHCDSAEDTERHPV